jgi:hypothetical protein
VTAFVVLSCRYLSQHKHHSQLLQQFEELSSALASIVLPLQLQSSRWRVLADLQPQGKMGSWRDSCKRSHEAFSAKVGSRKTNCW